MRNIHQAVSVSAAVIDVRVSVDGADCQAS